MNRVLTSFNASGATPLNGDYNTFIASGDFLLRISEDGTVGVPDSLSTLWLALPFAGVFAVAGLRRFAPRFSLS
jgi:hypothetical protein